MCGKKGFEEKMEVLKLGHQLQREQSLRVSDEYVSFDPASLMIIIEENRLMIDAHNERKRTVSMLLL